MPSENVKINIQEYDKTSPAGRGTDSTDIVFIPGFTARVIEDAAKETPIPTEPTLCTSVREFEELFGTNPYTLTEADVAGYEDINCFKKDQPDRSYVFAKELLYRGMPVVYYVVPSVGTSKLDSFYKADENGKYKINEVFNSVAGTIADKSVYSVKYITSGGYPSIIPDTETGFKNVFAFEMIEAAAHRGDAVALIDATMNDTETCFSTSTDSFYGKMRSLFSSKEHTPANLPVEYGAAMYPWAEYGCPSTLKTNPKITMPASFAYLLCVAKAIKTSPNWLAMAGVTRGVVPSILRLMTPGNKLSNITAEEMQPKFGKENHEISINCITDVKPYGLTLWGNRTLKPVDGEGTVALNFLNTRNMLSDIKKLLYTTAKSLMFEQNSESLWLRFKDGVSPLLNQLKMGNGISDFKIIKGTTKYNGDPLTKGELAAVIKIYPMYAVEYFELAVEINDEEVTVS